MHTASPPGLIQYAALFDLLLVAGVKNRNDTDTEVVGNELYLISRLMKL